MLGQLGRQSVQLSVREGISAQDLHEALDRILKESGCPACGLVGIDLRFRPVVDPVDFRQRFQDLTDVLDVNVDVVRDLGGISGGGFQR